MWALCMQNPAEYDMTRCVMLARQARDPDAPNSVKNLRVVVLRGSD
jgi:hypothetical protein